MKNETNTQNRPKTEATSLGEITTKLPDFAEYAAREDARFEEIAPAICARYGLDKDTNRELILQIDKAQHELAECEGCEGEPCQKKKDRYWVPVIKENGLGGWYVPRVICKVRYFRQLKSGCKRCKIPEVYATKTFDDYAVTNDNRRAVKIAKWFAAEKPEKSVYLYGECGTGKTFLASLIAKEFILDFKDVVFGDVPSLLDEIKRTFNDASKDSGAIVDHYCNCELLVLDDLGAGQLTEWNIGVIYSILNTRYNNGKPLIVTSNYDLDNLERRLGGVDATSAKRIVSRLSQMCVLGFLGTVDRRRQK